DPAASVPMPDGAVHPFIAFARRMPGGDGGHRSGDRTAPGGQNVPICIHARPSGLNPAVAPNWADIARHAVGEPLPSGAACAGSNGTVQPAGRGENCPARKRSTMPRWPAVLTMAGGDRGAATTRDRRDLPVLWRPHDSPDARPLLPRGRGA